MRSKDASLKLRPDRPGIVSRQSSCAARSLRQSCCLVAVVWLLVLTAGCRSFLGRSSDAVRQSELVKSLDDASVEVRLAALEDMEALREAALPENVGELIQDADPRIRRAAIAVVAARNHADPHPLLVAALEDPDVQVRLAAVVALGVCRDAKARHTLEGILDRDTETMRAAAVAALAAQGAYDAVQRVANDKSWRVRLAVATALAADASNESAEIALAMVSDRSAQVQQQAVEAVANWPIEMAGPVLLAAASSTSYMTSKLACEQLAARWPAARGLPAEPARGLSPGEVAAWNAQRGRHIAELRTQWIREFGDRWMIAAESKARESIASVATPEALLQAEKLVAALQAAGKTAEQAKPNVDALRAMGGDLLAVVDAWAREETKRSIPDQVFTEILTNVAPVLVTINELSSTDVNVRRKAAGKLADEANRAALSPAAVMRLAAVIEKEQDVVVWQQVLRAMNAPEAGGVTPAARQLALLALSHPAIEVRRRGCECVGSWGDPRLATLIATSLSDPSASVVTAAAKAFATLGAGDDPRPLLPLLSSGDRALRLAAAEALARGRYREGIEALERLAADGDATVRRQAALAIGRTRDAGFTELLVSMLDDRSPVQQAALESLTAIHGPEVGRANDGPSATVADQVARWKKWNAGQVRRG